MANKRKPQKEVIGLESSHHVTQRSIKEQISLLKSKLNSNPDLQTVIDKWELRLEKLNLDIIRQKEREERRAVKLAMYIEDVSTYKVPTND